MKVKLFRIEFDNDKEVYASGETLSGWLHVEVDPATSIRGFYIKFTGEACVKWREYVSRHYRKVVHEAYKTLFRHEMTGYVGHDTWFVHRTMSSITGNERPVTKDGLPPSVSTGRYLFPFKFQIPEKPLPASYEGQYGYVRYYIEARMDRTWKDEHFQIRGFSLRGVPVNLNERLGIRNPVGSSLEVEVAQGCITLKTIQVKVQTDRSGYVPGEVIHYKTYIINHSRHRVKKMKAFLVQIASCYGQRRDSSKKLCLREETIELAKVKGPGLEAEVTRRIEGDIEIPPLPPTGLEGFDNIDIRYQLEFTVKVANLAKTIIKVVVPVLIGNIPCDEVYTWKPAARTEVSLYSHECITGIPVDTSRGELPKESYEEVKSPLHIRKPADDDDVKEVITDLKVPYYPKYTCYRKPREVQHEMQIFSEGEDSVRFFFMKYMPYKVARRAAKKAYMWYQ